MTMADIQTLTKEKIKLDEPGLYDVIFLNDNITTMEFVVKVLKQIFGVQDCFKAIQDFYDNVQRYRFWPFFTKPFVKIVIHGIGTKRIPLIKKLLNRLEHQKEFYHHGDDTV
jgi:hypothetical protein